MKTIKFLSLCLMTCLLVFAFTSCGKDTDPAEKDLFIGTYKGHISYTSIDPIKHLDAPDGKVIVTKIGDTYSFHFSDDIPDLTGIKFEKKNDNSYVSIGSGLTGITISESNLTMLVVKGGETWTANCKR